MSLATDIEAARLQVVTLQTQLDAAQQYLDSLLAQVVKDGPDVSQFQGSVDWTQIAANAGFAFVRTSDGDVRDTAYNGARVAAIRQAGIPFGPYHFGRVASAGNNERNGRVEAGMAVYFAQSAGWGQPGDLPLAYDFETLNGQPAAKAAKHLIQFVKTYEWIMQHKPIVYINPATASQVVPELSDADKTVLGACPLWIAHWNAPAPTVPAPWTDWKFWQYTNQGTLPGISGAVDLNHFSGSKLDLDALRIV